MLENCQGKRKNAIFLELMCFIMCFRHIFNVNAVDGTLNTTLLVTKLLATKTVPNTSHTSCLRRGKSVIVVPTLWRDALRSNLLNSGSSTRCQALELGLDTRSGGWQGVRRGGVRIVRVTRLRLGCWVLVVEGGVYKSG